MVIRPTEVFKTIANKLGIACQGSEKHCQQAVKEYTKTAKDLKDKYNVAEARKKAVENMV